MRSIDEWLIFFLENDLSATELAKLMYNKELAIRRLTIENDKLKKENARLEEELNDALECEDPFMKAHKTFGKIVTEVYDPSKYLKRKVEREHREGIPIEEDCDD